MKRYFTKSVFKIALSCPTKLYYARHPEKYANSNDEDEFLAALAEGGFQVGELAKLYRHIDADLKHLSGYDEALAKTAELLQRDKVTIAEAAFRYENFFIRADIVEKRENDIHLIEVKAKSFGSDDSFMGKRSADEIKADYQSYIYDVAFQKYILQRACPQYHVHASLMLADKRVSADVDHLNQLFRLKKHNGKTIVVVADNAQQIISKSQAPVLTAFDVDDICNKVITGKTAEQEKLMGMPFVPFVESMCKAWIEDQRQIPVLGTKCFNCEFRKGESDLCDGHVECWRERAGFTDTDFQRPQVEELWGQWADRSKMLEKGHYFLSDLTEDDMKGDTGKPAEGLDHLQRKWLQVALATKNDELLRDFKKNILPDNNTYIDKEGLRKLFGGFGKNQDDKIKAPLHMIDFETTAVALPYHTGMRPYEQIAFQFSHHIIDIQKDGSYTIRHAGQWLNDDVNKFPNFDFVRELKCQLSQDEGTIFRYSNHENTILNIIRRQLEASKEQDKEELIAFIDTITHDKKGKRKGGVRDMVDLWEIVKSYYYNYSEMHGSNSIKQVLPAVLNSSKFLQDKYSRPIYGNEIESQNIKSSAPISWIQYEEGNQRVENPYHLLPSVASYLGITDEEVWRLEDNASDEYEGDSMTVANGGAALTAYSKLMFCDGQMNQALRTALLRYCELDTMAMVFIWEYFYHEINKSSEDTL